MKSIAKIWAASLLFTISTSCLRAQDVYPILSMDVATEAVANNLTPDSLPLLTDTTIFNVVMNVNLYDTLDIQNIEVNIGSSPGASDVFSRSFVYDVTGSLGGGISYRRDEYTVELGLGNLMHMLSYYAWVRIQKTNGSYTSAVVYNR